MKSKTKIINKVFQVILLTIIIILFVIFLLPSKLTIKDDIEFLTDNRYNGNIEIKGFNNSDNIPIEYTCDGLGYFPEIKINNLDSNDIREIVLIVERVDYDNNLIISHLILSNINPNTNTINNINYNEEFIIAKNSFNKNEYTPPCRSLSNNKEVNYYFNLYLLNDKSNINYNDGLYEAKKKINNKIISIINYYGSY